MSNEPTTRWICYQCGNLDHLDDGGLCRKCSPGEVQVVEWAVLCGWVVTGVEERVERCWEVR